jgi:hypothetical protein
MEVDDDFVVVVTDVDYVALFHDHWSPPIPFRCGRPSVVVLSVVQYVHAYLSLHALHAMHAREPPLRSAVADG